MTFLNYKYIPLVLIFGMIFFYLIKKHEKNFFKFVKKYWFFSPSTPSKLSRMFYYLFAGLLILSLLDLRGPEEKVKTQVPDQLTIILIDTSASMLVEDVRPNRFEKAIILARHFVKNAYGHKISVALFSDIQKQIVPFTDDFDLLDSRIAGLSELNILNGGSNIKQAITEAVQYFKANKGVSETSGNILIFTDGEAHSESFKIDVPDDVNIGVVGIGTQKGGPIPIRDRNNVLRGYKTYNGQKVNSELDENFLQGFSGLVKNFKYWIIHSYNIPTEEILSFFRTLHQSKISEGSVVVRPVYNYIIVIAAIICFFMSFIFRLAPTFVYSVAVFFIFLPSLNLKAEKPPMDMDKIEQYKDQFQLLKEGKLDKKNTLKLAEDLLKIDQNEEAATIYQENIKNLESEDIPTQFNYGTSKLKSKKLKDGLGILKDLQDKIAKMEGPQKAKIEEAIRNNILMAIDQQGKGEGKGEDNKDQKDKKENKKDQGQGESQENQDKDQKDKNQSEDQKQGQKNKDQKEKNKDKNKGDEKKDKEDEKEKEQKPQSVAEKEEEIKKFKNMVKLPAMVKQLLDEDRKLQEKHLDTRTDQRDQNHLQKDW